MAERLANGNTAPALLMYCCHRSRSCRFDNKFGQFRARTLIPVVTLSFAFRSDLFWRDVPLYLIAQFVGGIGGVIATNVMFGLPAVFVSHHQERDGPTI